MKRFLLTATLTIPLWAQAPAIDPAKVVAVIAGKDITVADVEKMLAAFNPQDLQMFQANPQLALSQYFLFIHLADEADKARLLEKSPYKEQFELLKIQLLRQARLNEENNTFTVTPEMIESYYKEHSAQYEQARIKVIQIAFTGQVASAGTGLDAIKAAAQGALLAAQAKRSEPEAKTLAEDIVKQLREGADFVKMVEKYSEDPTSKAAGGDFGVIKIVSEYPADLKSVVFALQPGEVSTPIRQPTAYYIIRLEEKGLQSIDEVREPIVQILRNDHMNQWMKDIGTVYQAVIKDPDLLKAVGALAMPAAPGAPPAKQ
ncbi:MAG TPA: peptidylprolyl isomerase [Bryobacteraceae bacterium]|nr:peptidylprolyl isomerase [Bryobacteraceae bacterium]